MKKLRGTYTVIVTPFTEDGTQVNETMLRWLVDYQISEGIHGIITLASNGEFLSLSDEERHEVIVWLLEVLLKDLADCLDVAELGGGIDHMIHVEA